jgi:hypothetical protein
VDVVQDAEQPFFIRIGHSGPSFRLPWDQLAQVRRTNLAELHDAMGKGI